MWRHVNMQTDSDVSKNHNAFIFQRHAVQFTSPYGIRCEKVYLQQHRCENVKYRKIISFNINTESILLFISLKDSLKLLIFISSPAKFDLCQYWKPTSAVCHYVMLTQTETLFHEAYTRGERCITGFC